MMVMLTGVRRYLILFEYLLIISDAERPFVSGMALCMPSWKEYVFLSLEPFYL